MINKIFKKLAVIFAFLLLLSFPSSGAETGGEESAPYPLLFLSDDVWYRDAAFTYEEHEGEIFIPISAFARLDGVTFKEDTDLGSVMLAKDGRCFSIDLSNGRVITPGVGNGYSHARFFYRHDMLYISLSAVCEQLKLSSELYEYQNKQIAIRITTGEEKLDFPTLISITTDISTEKIERLEYPAATSPLYKDGLSLMISDLSTLDGFFGSGTDVSGRPHNTTVYLDVRFANLELTKALNEKEWLISFSNILAADNKIVLYSDKGEISELYTNIANTHDALYSVFHISYKDLVFSNETDQSTTDFFIEVGYNVSIYEEKTASGQR